MLYVPTSEFYSCFIWLASNTKSSHNYPHKTLYQPSSYNNRLFSVIYCRFYRASSSRLEQSLTTLEYVNMCKEENANVVSLHGPLGDGWEPRTMLQHSPLGLSIKKKKQCKVLRGPVCQIVENSGLFKSQNKWKPLQSLRYFHKYWIC